MTATIDRRRLTWFLIIAVAVVVAVSYAACGNSSNDNNAKPGTSATSTPPASRPPAAPPPPPAPPMGHDEIEGLVRSVSGNTIQLTQRDRSSATVDFTQQTMVTELSSAALPDVKPGSCVDIKPTPQNPPPDGPITAESVELSPSEGGRCPPPVGPPVAGAVSGIVDWVTSDTIAVNAMDPTGKATHTTVTVSPTTTYTKHAVTDAHAIQNGKCLAAQGTKDGGVLQAQTIDLEPCPPMGGGHHHHFHIPWPHHHHL